MQAANVPGLSIALIQEGEIVWVEGFGKANTITGKPVAGDTVFEAASISKAIAAYAAMVLVERGVLALDEPMHRYLSQPWLPPSAYAEQITLRQLLSHTSGLTNNVNPVDKSIASPPGERFAYSGVGFMVLQEVLEQVTGKSFEQIAQELVFEPLAMDSSSYVVPQGMMPRLANGHINYGFLMPALVVVLAAAFALTLLACLIIQRIRLGKFTLSGRMLGISYLIAASIVLVVVVYFVGGGFNKWATFVALWLALFGGGMALLLFAGKKLTARLSGKWQKPALVLWSIIGALAMLLLTNALTGPIPRFPAGPPGAFATLRTTAPDLAKFLLELASPQHLDPALMAEMTSPQVQSGENESWGLGIGIRHGSQGDVLWHDGNNPDFHALMLINQEQQNGVVILTNGEHGASLVNDIADHAMTKLEVKPTPTAVPTPSATVRASLAPTHTISNSEYLQVFEAVWSTVNETYFDPEFGGLDWDAVHSRYKPLIIAAKDDEELYDLLNQMLRELNVSHAGVWTEDMWPAIEPVGFGRGEIGIDVRLLDDQAVITRVEAGSPAEKAGLRPGFVIQSIKAKSIEQIIADAQEDLSPPYNDQSRINSLTLRLLSLIYGDPGTCVSLAYLDERDELHEGCVERIQRPRAATMEGIPLPPFYLEFESERLESGVGYIRFNTFHPDLVPDMVEGVAALQDASGIIIDLRGNPGGNPDTAEQLAAQFLNGQVLFGYFRTRDGTIVRTLTGENVSIGPLVILIDALSYSGSEHFASGMQAVGRAVIVGERSPGGAIAMNVAILPNGAQLGYPVAQLLAPDGIVVEGRGVIPDITVALERSQLLAGIDAQLQAAIDYIVETVR
jgi:carboxyl-terminal processing protease